MREALGRSRSLAIVALFDTIAEIGRGWKMLLAREAHPAWTDALAGLENARAASSSVSPRSATNTPARTWA